MPLREQIDRAAALADVRDNIVDFKDGFETMLGERGVTVSGGQKQRISIARALLKDAPILYLDDSVSAVDTRTEKVDPGKPAHQPGGSDHLADPLTASLL